MSKAEERALEAYPVLMCYNDFQMVEEDVNKPLREIYQEGYHQAEKDLELSWEDIRELYIIFAEVDTEIELCKVDDIKAETLGYYQEVLKRFKDFKERKQQ